MADAIAAPTFVTSAVALFTICNPIGSLPVFLDVTKDREPKQQRRIGIVVGIAVIAILAISLVAGTFVLELFGIDITAFKIAGNLLVAFIGWAMLLARRSPVATNDGEGSPAVVPLAMPVIAGPGAIALAITFAHSYTSILDYAIGLAIIVVVGLACSIVLYFGPTVHKVLGPAGMNVITRVFGLLLLAIAVQAIVTSLGQALPGLLGSST
ncbi:MarC family protein [Microbacterium sp. RD1]|uniref:MarC family protein n=1 Tax=Microbacterium sp. RD1 TaxID=3457313 RepID=UPI003FA57B4C